MEEETYSLSCMAPWWWWGSSHPCSLANQTDQLEDPTFSWCENENPKTVSSPSRLPGLHVQGVEWCWRGGSSNFSDIVMCIISFQVLQGHLEGKLLLWHCSMVSGEEGLQKSNSAIFSVAPTFYGHSVGSNDSRSCFGGDWAGRVALWSGGLS